MHLKWKIEDIKVITNSYTMEDLTFTSKDMKDRFKNNEKTTTKFILRNQFRRMYQEETV